MQRFAMNRAMILVALSTAGLQACVMAPPQAMVVRQPPVMIQQPAVVVQQPPGIVVRPGVGGVVRVRKYL